MARLTDPHAELPIKNYKYVKNCTELYLAQRGIQQIANFDGFVNLEVLWINNNEIETLSGLDQCFRIKSLHAHNNLIRTLEGCSLVHFKFLEELRLYGNKITDLQSTLRVLGRLQHLRDLDLFGNPVAEEEGYRYHIIITTPSLLVLDRHVVTDYDREKAARLSRLLSREPDKEGLATQRIKCRPATVSGAPPQQVSGTVRLLMTEIAVTKRQQQQQAFREAQQELQGFEVTKQQDLQSTLVCGGQHKPGIAIPIPSLDEWEFNNLRKCFQMLEGTKNSGLRLSQIKHIESHLYSRGFELYDEQCRPLILESLSIADPFLWPDFVQLFISKQVSCKLMTASKLRVEAAGCFERCQILQRHLLAGSNVDTTIMAELQKLSQQGYRLQALADSASTAFPLAVTRPKRREIGDQMSSRTRFCFTTFAKESISPFSTTCQPVDSCTPFLDLKAECTSIDEALCHKYKLRGKDFHKYLTKQTPHPQTILTRQKFEL